VFQAAAARRIRAPSTGVVIAEWFGARYADDD
jgi:hypothetical protein